MALRQALAQRLFRFGRDERLPVVLTQRRIFILPTGAGLLYAAVLCAMLIGAILGALYMVLRPLLRLLLKVISWLTLGLINVVIDAWLVWTAASMMDGAVTFDNFWWAAAVALAVNVARTLIGALTGSLRK